MRNPVQQLKLPVWSGQAVPFKRNTQRVAAISSKLVAVQKKKSQKPLVQRVPRLVALTQTRKVWFDVGYFNVVIYTVLY